MKKTPLILSIATLFSLVSCNNNNETVHKTFISEVYVEKSPFNSMIEVTSLEDSFNYTLNFYRSRSLYESIDLSSYLSKDKNYVIIGNNSIKEELKSYCDLILSSDCILGNNYIEIVDSNNNVIDSVGNAQFDSTYISQGTLVKNENNLFSTASFSQYDWYKVSDTTQTLSYLGNLNTPITYKEFIDGPHLEEKYFNLKYTDGKDALGGLMEVSVKLNEAGKFSYSDGDTTNFVPSEEYSYLANDDGYIRVRYFFINTPEIDHGGVFDDENIKDSDSYNKYGADAAYYVIGKLKNAKHIMLQSALGSTLHDTYGRTLGLVWYTNVENPSPSDYNLLNYEVIKESYSKLQGGDELVNLTYKGVPLHYYAEITNELASKEGLRIWE